MKKILKLLGIIIVVILGILIFNTLRLGSKQVASDTLEKVTLPNDIFQNLSNAIKYPTISFSEEAIPDSTAFYGFHRYLEEAFPLTHAKLSLEKINDIVYYILGKGRTNQKSQLF